jgi:proline iminopeptidase
MSKQKAPRPVLLDLFPPISPYSSGFLDVEEPHKLYWEQSGNPDGVPVVFLHGGPGAGAMAAHRRFFDPDYYRIIIFDQRGAGRSQPLGELEKNNVQALVDDIERLRTHLNVKHWHVFGGSWGSTLALAYAQQFPDQCLSLILRGIFLMEEPEIEWFMSGMQMIFPEAWEQFAGYFPGQDGQQLLESYYRQLTQGSADEQMEAAIRWALYESACASLFPNYETITTQEQKNCALSVAKIEAHYFTHHVIDADHSLLNGVDKIRHIPTTIVQGRYDVICPITTAHRLHAKWPEADYIIVPDGGHSAMDPAIRSRLIEATENAKTLL